MIRDFSWSNLRKNLFFSVFPEWEWVPSIRERIEVSKNWAVHFLPWLVRPDFYCDVRSRIMSAVHHLVVIQRIRKLAFCWCSWSWTKWRKIWTLTPRLVGPTWEVRNCLRGPPVLNSLLGVICQKPTSGSTEIHPWTPMSLLSQEYSYLSST